MNKTSACIFYLMAVILLVKMVSVESIDLLLIYGSLATLFVFVGILLVNAKKLEFL